MAKIELSKVGCNKKTRELANIVMQWLLLFGRKPVTFAELKDAGFITFMYARKDKRDKLINADLIVSGVDGWRLKAQAPKYMKRVIRLTEAKKHGND